MDELIVVLMLWLTTTAGYGNADPPKVELVTQERMQEMYFSIHEKYPATFKGVHAYNRMTGESVIYLNENFDPKNPEDKSTLLHELVHHYQRKEGRGYGCDSLLEAEAYFMELSWREENGLNPSIDPLSLGYLFLCVDFSEQHKIRNDKKKSKAS